MARTNIDIDDDAVARVMARYDLPSKRAAVDFALRQVAGPPITVAEIDSLRGAWKGLEEVPIPDSPVSEWTTSSPTHGAPEPQAMGEDPRL